MQTNTYELSIRGHSMPCQLRRYIIYPRKSTEDPNGLTVIEYDWHPIIYIYIYIYHWISLISQKNQRCINTPRHQKSPWAFQLPLQPPSPWPGKWHPRCMSYTGRCIICPRKSTSDRTSYVSTWLNMINHANQYIWNIPPGSQHAIPTQKIHDLP